jgi:hypothetical protein
VNELHSKLQTFISSLESLGDVANEIESSGPRTKSESNYLLRMQNGLAECREILEALLGREDEITNRGTDSIAKRVFRDWFYNNGEAEDIDRAVRAIVDRMEAIKTALLSLNTYVLRFEFSDCW